MEDIIIDVIKPEVPELQGEAIKKSVADLTRQV
jgi:hypothetical protein